MDKLSLFVTAKSVESLNMSVVSREVMCSSDDESYELVGEFGELFYN